LYFVKFANSNFMTVEQIRGVLMFQTVLLKRTHTHKRGTKAKVRDHAGNAEVCMSKPNQFHHHGAILPLIRFCKGGYGTIQIVRAANSISN
jgi:hypothetical protein